MDKILITAHSGCEGTGIDTMDSIEKALKFGADAVEIDVRVDPFGCLRISHNPLSLEDYFQKNPLADVFDRVISTSLRINFDLKEEAALYKTLNAAHDFGFPTERLFFSGAATPELLMSDPVLSQRANFYLNFGRVLKHVYAHRKNEFTREAFSLLMEYPYIIFIDKNSPKPDVYFSEAVELWQKVYAISKTFAEKIFADAIRIFQKTHAAAANLPKFLVWTSVDDILKACSIPLSFWTVDEPDMIRRCLEIGACNITTRKVQLTKQIISRYTG